MESSITSPGAPDPASAPVDPVPPVAPVDPAAPEEPGEDPSARTDEQEAEHDPTPTSQDAPAEEIEQTALTPGGTGDPANQVHRQAAPPADWQSGEPSPGDEAQDRGPVQTAGGSTDGLSTPAPVEEAEEPVEEDGEPNPEDVDR